MDSIDIDRVLPQIAALKSQLGAVTGSYSADRQAVIRILNEVLPTEIVCVLRYKRHYYMATGIHAQRVAQEFLEHANEEKTHADIAAERITHWGANRISIPTGEPQPFAIRRRQILLDMVREDLVAERIAVESYNEIIRYLGNDDPTYPDRDGADPLQGGRARRRYEKAPRNAQ